MADKSNFSPDEWKLLQESVMMAGIAITAAEPSGLWGLLKESFAEGKELAVAEMDPKTNPLTSRRRARCFGLERSVQACRDQNQVHRDAAASRGHYRR